jgi:hypothetical protein
MDIYGGSYLTGTIKTNTTITLILSVGTKVDLRNAASDDSVIVTTSRPAPNGQAPLQLQVSAPVAMPAAVATPDVATKSKFLGF